MADYFKIFSYRGETHKNENFFQKGVDKSVSKWIFTGLSIRHAALAQLVEQLTLNQLVPGSSPGGGTIY